MVKNLNSRARWVRNPMYLDRLFIIAGFLLLLGQSWIPLPGAVGDFLVRLVDRVAQLDQVGLADDVEGGHGTFGGPLWEAGSLATAKRGGVCRHRPGTGRPAAGLSHVVRLDGIPELAHSGTTAVTSISTFARSSISAVTSTAVIATE